MGSSPHAERAPEDVKPEHGETVSTASIPDLARLVGDRVVVLHSPSGEGLSGRDVDCAVSGLDPLWPLRLGQGWRLCQFSQYDLRGWFWVLERNGELLHLDTIDDPLGVGRDGFPTASLAHTDGGEVSPPARAAYLAIKRLRKGTRAEPEWERIRSLAAENWDAFGAALHTLAGRTLARLLYGSVRSGEVLPKDEWRKARAVQVVRRFRTPSRSAAALWLQILRVLDRVAHPTGWSVLIVGPDGSGKSTLAQALVEGLAGVFRREATFHWRAAVLPRPGAVLGRTGPDTSRPHARPPHGRLLSLGLVAYYWLDFLVGGWVRTWPVRLRTGLVVTERGWWDLAVDPRRYRLNVSPTLVRALGALLPHPDVVFSLEAPSRVLLERKAELPERELDRQRAAWRESLPQGVPAISLDSSMPAHEVAGRMREEALRLLESRAVRRLGAGWHAFRRKGRTRWWLPRGPREVATESLSIYQPVTVRGRSAWEAARLGARVGGFRLLRRGEPPPRAVREALSSYLPSRATLAVSVANHPGRYLAAILDGEGSCQSMAKVATEPIGIEALRKEAEAIDTFGSLLPPPVAAPRILANEPGVLLLEAVQWRPRAHPWSMDAEVARALGVFFQANGGSGKNLEGLAHGDCAPWNLLQTERGWVLVDWEAARSDAPPFYDLCHYLIQGHTLLRRPSWVELRKGFLDGVGWVGALVRAYGDGAGVSPEEASTFLESYLRTTQARMEAEDRWAGAIIRSRLLQDLAG